MEYRTHSADQLRALATDFISKRKRSSAATVIALSGELGAGKTCFAQGVAAALGVAETVSSPTFVIEKVYDLQGQRWERLVHIDAYRLKDEAELSVLHWDDLVRDPGNIILIEWPERVPAAIPAGASRMHFGIDGDGRIITINGEEDSGKDDSAA